MGDLRLPNAATASYERGGKLLAYVQALSARHSRFDQPEAHEAVS